jgi:hypothetical protein
MGENAGRFNAINKDEASKPTRKRRGGENLDSINRLLREILNQAQTPHDKQQRKRQGLR